MSHLWGIPTWHTVSLSFLVDIVKGSVSACRDALSVADVDVSRDVKERETVNYSAVLEENLTRARVPEGSDRLICFRGDVRRRG